MFFPPGRETRAGPSHRGDVAAADISSRRFFGGPTRDDAPTSRSRGDSRADGEGKETRGDSAVSSLRAEESTAESFRERIRETSPTFSSPSFFFFFFSGVRASTKAATRARSRRSRRSSSVSSGSGTDGRATP
jgi:hypothetical protein